MTKIKDAVVWITGASSGIGEATAIEMAKKGAKLVLSARNEQKLNEVKNSLGLSDSEVLVLPIDMTDPSQFEPATQKVLDTFGRIDILFNNAGVSQRSSVLETKMEVHKDLMEVNYWGPVGLTNVVLPHFIKQKSGHILITSSLSGKLGSPMRSGYCASKHALHGFFDALRSEVSKDNIKITMICPGYIKTDISKNAFAADGSKHGQMDQNQDNGLTVGNCAEKIVRATEKNKSEIYIGGKEVAGVYLKRFFPSLLERILINQAPK